MTKSYPLRGIILSVVDERGPHPTLWYPNFANLAQIHNSSVKSFSILIGDKSYREKTPSDLTCFGILPFPDIKSIGFIHFSGFDDLRRKKSLTKQLPATITLLFDESYRDQLCQKGPELHQFIEREASSIWSSVQEENSSSQILSNLYAKLEKFLAED